MSVRSRECVDADLRMTVVTDSDIVTTRSEGRRFASALNFSSSDLTVIATAISEVVRNVVSYAGRGEVYMRLAEKDGLRGVEIVARDDGPGIRDLDLALQDGYSTSGSLGLGLPGARRLMDEFEIDSELGKGTVVTMRMWTRR
jgi:serine/threonine-protein kinase RsbT